MDDIPSLPSIVPCIWDTESNKYVPLSSHRGSEIFKSFPRPTLEELERILQRDDADFTSPQ